MRAIDKYLTEAKIRMDRNTIKKIVLGRKSGVYEIDGKKVQITVAGDMSIWKYQSDFFELSYELIDIADDMGKSYQQLGMNTKKEMKFIIDFS